MGVKKIACILIYFILIISLIFFIVWGIFNFDKIKDFINGSEKEYFTIVFKDEDNIISEKKYEKNQKLIIPEAPKKEGYEFIAWHPSIQEAVTEDKVYQAEFEKLILIQFLGINDEILYKEYLHKDEPFLTPEPPLVENFRFVKWDKEINNVAIEDITYKAEYIEQVLIRFLDWDDTEISSTIYDLGADIVLPPEPTREGYKFIWWDNYTAYANFNVDMKARYEELYKVEFKDWDDTILSSKWYEKGHSLTEIPTVPKREGYVFINWSPDISYNVNSSIIYTAEYKKSYTITFLDFGGNVMKTGEYAEGTLINDIVPSILENPIYKDIHWDVTPEGNVKEDVTYRLIGTRVYDIQFCDWDNTEISVKKYELGETVEEPPAPIRDGYRFLGWHKEITIVKGADLYIATYIKTYQITFKDWDNTVISSLNYDVDSVITLESPTREGYQFIGWSPELETVSKDAEYIAEYAKLFLITFLNEDGTEISSGYQVENNEIQVPNVPVIENKAFIGWYPDLESIITSDKTYTAIYVNQYLITFKSYDGTVIESSMKNANSDLVAPVAPEREGYNFLGWSPSLEKVTKNAIYTAVYIANIENKFSNGFYKSLNQTLNNSSYNVLNIRGIINNNGIYSLICDFTVNNVPYFGAMMIWADSAYSSDFSSTMSQISTASQSEKIQLLTSLVGDVDLNLISKVKLNLLFSMSGQRNKDILFQEFMNLLGIELGLNILDFNVTLNSNSQGSYKILRINILTDDKFISYNITLPVSFRKDELLITISYVAAILRGDLTFTYSNKEYDLTGVSLEFIKEDELTVIKI